MAEIDRRRARADVAIEERRKWNAVIESGYSSGRDVKSRDLAECTVEWAEANVLEALREWWAQGCRDGISSFGLRASVAVAETEPRECVCSSFDDGSRFELASFAGGGAPGGAFSFVTCRHTTATGRSDIIRYVREAP
jgi:hypothetical protein